MSVGGDGGMGSYPQGYPQQGYPPPGYFQPYGAPVRLRANAVASVLAGVLALLTAGLLVWFVVANMVAHDGPAPWPSGVRINVVGGFCAAGVLVIASLFTFARAVAGAWAVCVTTLSVLLDHERRLLAAAAW